MRCTALSSGSDNGDTALQEDASVSEIYRKGVISKRLSFFC